ncbi:MAG TPA: hypothetical protein VM934_05225 [Pyrinomonadaceae bacterium]|jgi:hypothetical protein|nr:hypothetical protein [Pyrinomonadaceae bacterium]
MNWKAAFPVFACLACIAPVVVAPRAVAMRARMFDATYLTENRNASANRRARRGRKRAAVRKRKEMSEQTGVVAGARVPEGVWGGDGVRVQVAGESANVTFDCAHGTISGPLELDAEGRFDWQGTHTREYHGYLRPGLKPPVRAARYKGRIEAERMTLAVTLADTNETVATFTLARGSAGRIGKCR